MKKSSVFKIKQGASVFWVVAILFAVGLMAFAYTKSPTEPTDNTEETANVSTSIEDSEPSISVQPRPIIQGEAVLVSVRGVEEGNVESLTFNGKELDIFTHNGAPSALIGLDLRMNPGTYPLIASLSDGDTLREDVRVASRIVEKEEFGIPEKLGGNTPQSEQKLINTLAQEAAIMNAIPSGDEKLWQGSFRLPLDPPSTVTSVYGYSRITGGSTLSHKGTDFRANVGTPVYAMNSGRVQFTEFMRNYGHTVVLDHGLGLHTVYMHLSEILVEDGQMVEKGQLIARTGDTGYVLGPHLHLSVRIDTVSIDPMRFMELFGN